MSSVADLGSVQGRLGWADPGMFCRLQVEKSNESIFSSSVSLNSTLDTVHCGLFVVRLGNKQ